MNNYENANYNEIFPENLKKYKNLKKIAKNIEETLKKYIVPDISNLAFFYNLELENDNLLDELAWIFSIDGYTSNLPRDIKIKLIKSAYFNHSKKGTKNAIISQLKTLGYYVKLEEWFEYNGKPFTYRLVTEIEVGQDRTLKNILELIESYKNVRSILDSLRILRKKEGELFVGAWKEINKINELKEN